MDNFSELFKKKVHYVQMLHIDGNVMGYTCTVIDICSLLYLCIEDTVNRRKTIFFRYCMMIEGSDEKKTFLTDKTWKEGTVLSPKKSWKYCFYLFEFRSSFICAKILSLLVRCINSSPIYDLTPYLSYVSNIILSLVKYTFGS